MHIFLQEDVLVASRLLRRQRGLAVSIVGILAVAIGATTSVFSLAYALLLRPLPFPAPERLMSIPLTVPPSSYRPGGGDNPWWSYPKFEFFRTAQRSFTDLAIYSERPFTLNGGNGAERVIGEGVGARYLATLGVPIALGRDFNASEDDPGAFQGVTVISDELWKRRFAADSGIVGRLIWIDAKPVTVIGVLPAGFRGLTGHAEIFVPLRVIGSADLGDPGSHYLEVVGRLAPGIRFAQADDEVRRIGPRIDEQFPIAAVGRGWSARAFPLDAARAGGDTQPWVIMLLGSVALVLLIACANIANLLLARAVIRQREIAIRLALGASRARLIRQLLAESALLSLLGAVAGLVLAWGATRMIAALAPAGVQRSGGRLAGLLATEATTVGIDVWVVLFCTALAMVTTCVFGILPALRATKPELTRALKSGGDRGGSSRGPSTRGALVAAEVGLTLVLLAGTGLLLRSLTRLVRVNPGVDVTNTLTVRISAPGALYARDSLPDFYTQLLERTRALPGVRSAAAADCPPMTGGCNVTEMWFRGGAHPSGERGLSIGAHFVSREWLTTLGVPLLRGRWFDATDRIGSPRAVVINETAARRYWPSENPIGQSIGVGMAGFNDGAMIVGVVGDVYFGSLDSLPRPDVYLSIQQAPRNSMVLFVKASGNPLALVPPIRAAVRQLDSRLPLYDIRTMQDRVDETTARVRFSMTLLAAFAAIALALAVFGTYSVTAYTVAQSTREIGIRAALGAAPLELLGAMVRRELRYVMIGVCGGVAVAAFVTRTLTTLLYGMSAVDPYVYAASALLMLFVGGIASFIPARRVLRVDPVRALSAE